MNKQELIKKYEKECEMIYGFPVIRLNLILEDLKQLDEPQKVKIPEFVADWLEYSKNTSLSLVRSLMLGNVDFGNYANQKDHSKLIEFFRSGINQELFARAWLYGYEIEKEKKYTVKVKAVLGQYLGRYYLNNEELTPQFTRTQLTGKNELPTFTRKELENTCFGWVFNCPGIEVKEWKE